MRLRLCSVLFLFLLCAQSVSAQSFAADVHFASARWDVSSGPDNDYGIGGRVSWMPSSWTGLDANLVWYPQGFPRDTDVPISDYRIEGLFGVTIGPKIDRVRPFGKAAAGFLRVGGARDPIACITIFPPPMICTLAGGRTLPAYEIGGGIEVDATSSAFIRGDIGARFLKFPGPAIDAAFQVRDDDYFEHGLRLTIGAGFRF